MDILFDNVLENYDTLVSTNSNINYPVANLVHPFLRQRFQSSGASSLITFTFSEDQTMNCIFFGYYTATAIDVVFKDSLDATLETLNLTTMENLQAFKECFDLLTTVRSIEITITGSTGVFLGGVGAGVCFEMPNFLSVYSRGNKDNSAYVESTDGQTLQNYTKPLRTYNFSFTAKDNEDVEDYVNSVGIGRALYFNIPNVNADPIYAKITNSFNTAVGRITEKFTLQIREAR